MNTEKNPTRHEFPDDTPIAKPLRWNRQGSTLDQIRESIRFANIEAARQGKESYEEANDFDTGEDDLDPPSRSELAATAAYMSPEELYEHVFKKPYEPPPVATGKPSAEASGPGQGNPPPVAVPPITVPQT